MNAKLKELLSIPKERRLPILPLGGRYYFVDQRLNQIRAWNNPHIYEDVTPELVSFWQTEKWLL